MSEQTARQQQLQWMDQAIEAATRNVEAGGGPFGALIVRDGLVLATGTNQVTPSLDPTAHAEVVAIRAACQAIGDYRLTGCVLVTSCEPCPLCLSAALWARVDTVLYAADRDDAAKAGFDDRAFYDLFATPREEWTMRIAQVAGPNRTRPFDTWLSTPHRTEY